MRLAILIVGGLATGALTVGAGRTLVPPNAQMFQAVRALGGDPASIRIGDINPVKAYEDVKRQITSGNFGRSVNFGSAPPVSGFPRVGDLSLGTKYHMDDAAMRQAIGASINSRVQQDIRRGQDLAAYGRNPMAWHGAPPH
jgi:hypothetical protein